MRSYTRKPLDSMILLPIFKIMPVGVKMKYMKVFLIIIDSLPNNKPRL